MFQQTRKSSVVGSALTILSLIYHNTVRDVRSSHSNAFIALGTNMLTAIIFVLAFYFMFSVLGLRGAKLRGDFLLYMMSGIFLYLTHIKALGAVAGAEGPTSPMMQHAPMNTLVAILSSALSVLYTQTVSLLMILLLLHTVLQPITIHYWPGALLMFILSWASGCVIGLLFMALKPWVPDLAGILQQVYVRANMIASGKMFVANMMPTAVIGLFDWNPLFHIIDQARGFTFVNYFPHHSNWQYPVYATLVLLVIGMMGEAYTRRYASDSWNAGR
jgi:ABC-type polysaccharide/polyol phosphate export permease